MPENKPTNRKIKRVLRALLKQLKYYAEPEVNCEKGCRCVVCRALKNGRNLIKEL